MDSDANTKFSEEHLTRSDKMQSSSHAVAGRDRQDTGRTDTDIASTLSAVFDPVASERLPEDLEDFLDRLTETTK